jgi:DNA replication protein DnaC
MTITLNIESYLRSIGLPSRYLTATFDNYKIYNDRQKKCVEVIKQVGQKWLCLTGKTGTGKTHLAAAFLRQQIEPLGGPADFIYSGVKGIVDDLLAADFAGKVAITRELSTARILVIDEIGRSIETKYFQDFIFEILNNRYNEYRQTILISNLSKEELFGKYFDDALARRITEMGETINFDWDFYDKKGREQD